MTRNNNVKPGDTFLRVPQSFFRRTASLICDINNALSCLSGHFTRIKLKRRRNPNLKVSEAVDSLEGIEENIYRIKGMVQGIANVLVQWGNEKIEFESVNLAALIRETIDLAQSQIGKNHIKGIKVESTIPDDIAPIFGSFKKLQEVFLNLLINAFEAINARPNGLIRITVERRDAKDSSCVAVDFTDNGPGIPEKIAGKVFHPGFTTKKERLARAIDLFKCKQIIELHGGSIDVERKLGEGTKFEIQLPVYKEATTEG